MSNNCDISLQPSTIVAELILEPKYHVLLAFDDEDLDCELPPRLELDLFPVLPINNEEEEFDTDLLLYYNIAKL
ncbi:MAG TPA: hypothetical protein VN698_14205 [Bacteroidia bacterium]|nr:hypothetical protein [Bacteroidia bacterium]